MLFCYILTTLSHFSKMLVVHLYIFDLSDGPLL